MSNTKAMRYRWLRVQVATITQLGDSCEIGLGAIKMPSGYALVWSDSAEMYYWIRWDGKESDMWGNRWNCYRNAKSDSRMSVLREGEWHAGFN